MRPDLDRAQAAARDMVLQPPAIVPAPTAGVMVERLSDEPRGRLTDDAEVEPGRTFESAARGAGEGTLAQPAREPGETGIAMAPPGEHVLASGLVDGALPVTAIAAVTAVVPEEAAIRWSTIDEGSITDSGEIAGHIEAGGEVDGSVLWTARQAAAPAADVAIGADVPPATGADVPAATGVDMPAATGADVSPAADVDMPATTGVAPTEEEVRAVDGAAGADMAQAAEMPRAADVAMNAAQAPAAQDATIPDKALVMDGRRLDRAAPAPDGTGLTADLPEPAHPVPADGPFTPAAPPMPSADARRDAVRPAVAFPAAGAAGRPDAGGPRSDAGPPPPPSARPGDANRPDFPDQGRPGCTTPQLRRFIKSRAYVPMHELRRRFSIDGPEDDVTKVATEAGHVFIGLPEREGRMIGDLLRQGEIGFELSLDPSTPIVIGVYPMRPVIRS